MKRALKAIFFVTCVMGFTALTAAADPADKRHTPELLAQIDQGG